MNLDIPTADEIRKKRNSEDNLKIQSEALEKLKIQIKERIWKLAEPGTDVVRIDIPSSLWEATRALDDLTKEIQSKGYRVEQNAVAGLLATAVSFFIFIPDAEKME